MNTNTDAGNTPRLAIAPQVGGGSVVGFVILAYGFSWVAFLAYVLPNLSTLTIERAWPYLAVGQFGPTVAAVVITAREGGMGAVRQLLLRLLPVRFPLRWWAVATWLIALALLVVLAPLAFSADSAKAGPWLGSAWQIVLLPLIAVFAVILGVGPLGEELGWRGFLLPRLIGRYSPSVSNLILGLIWAFWHLPLFLIGDWRNGLSLPLFTVLYPLTLIMLSYGMYFLWKNTGGSVLAAMLFHGAFNAAASNLVPEFVAPLPTYLAVAGGIGLWVLLARRLDDPALPANPYTATSAQSASTAA